MFSQIKIRTENLMAFITFVHFSSLRMQFFMSVKVTAVSERGTTVLTYMASFAGMFCQMIF